MDGLAAALAVAAACASYYLVERPFLRRQNLLIGSRAFRSRASRAHLANPVRA